MYEKWFVGFYGISTFVGYLAPNPFLCKQFSLAWVHSLIVKNSSISNKAVVLFSLERQFYRSTLY